MHKKLCVVSVACERDDKHKLYKEWSNFEMFSPPTVSRFFFALSLSCPKSSCIRSSKLQLTQGADLDFQTFLFAAKMLLRSLRFMLSFYCKEQIVYINGCSSPLTSYLIFSWMFLYSLSRVARWLLTLFLGQFIFTFTNVCQVLALYHIYISQSSFAWMVHLHTCLWILLNVCSQQLGHFLHFILVPARLSAVWHCHICFLHQLFMCGV